MTPTPIAAIPTRYAGCHFRSRLEARWAVFFDQLNVSWQYEPQGYLIDGTPYLPDFYLPQSDIWVEVKGSEPAWLATADRCAAAATRLGSLLILGPIPDPERVMALHTILLPCGTHSVGRHWTGLGRLNQSREMFLCGMTCLDCSDGALESDLLKPTTAPHIEWFFGTAEPTRGAYLAARTARFEHGETPERPR